MQLRPYQITNALRGAEIIQQYGFCYLQMEVRTGKTVTSLEICKLLGAKKALFSTKKNVIKSIQDDYIKFGYDIHFELDVINDEQLHKVTNIYDIAIHDEHHRFGAFPKMNKGAKIWEGLFKNTRQIWLSGTPSPESYSQLYHQFKCHANSPFKAYKNFYKFAQLPYIERKQMILAFGTVTDYSQGQELIKTETEPYCITFTQKQAGFVVQKNINIVDVDYPKELQAIYNTLKRDKIVHSKKTDDYIIGDLPPKLLSKLHQLSSGTCILNDSGNEKTSLLSDFKAKRIYNDFKGKKIVVFVKFIAEKQLIKEVFRTTITESVEEFQTTNKSLVIQMVSGREGLNLSKASDLVYLTPDYSAITYFQAQDRMTTIDRESAEIHYYIATNLERDILKVVTEKKKYTLKYFDKYERI